MSEDIEKMKDDMFQSEAAFEARTTSLAVEYDTKLRVELDQQKADLTREKDAAVKALQVVHETRSHELMATHHPPLTSHPLTNPLPHPPIHSLTHPLTHSLNHPLTALAPHHPPSQEATDAQIAGIQETLEADFTAKNAQLRAEVRYDLPDGRGINLSIHTRDVM